MPVEQPKAPATTLDTPSFGNLVVEGPYLGWESPPQKIVIIRKGKKRSHDLLVIPEYALAEADTAVLSSVFDTTDEEQEEEDEPTLRPCSYKKHRIQAP